MKSYINSLFAGVGTLATYLLGGWDVTLRILVTVMFLDLLSGLLAGGFEHVLSSKEGFNGLKKKATMLIYLILSVMLDNVLGNEQMLFRTLMSCYLIGNEGLSILENGARLGVPLPQKIVDVLVQLKEGK